MLTRAHFAASSFHASRYLLLSIFQRLSINVENCLLTTHEAVYSLFMSVFLLLSISEFALDKFASRKSNNLLLSLNSIFVGVDRLFTFASAAVRSLIL